MVKRIYTVNLLFITSLDSNSSADKATSSMTNKFRKNTLKVADINGKEIIAENYESKLLMTSLNVPINNKYMDLKNLDPGNGIISVSYTDHNHVLAPFVPYRMTLNVQCEVEDGQN